MLRSKKWALRCATVAVAVSGIAATMPSAAHAADATIGSWSCGSADQTFRISMKACIHTFEDNGRVYYRAEADTTSTAAMDPAAWSLCEVRIGLDERYASSTTWTRTATKYHSGTQGCTPYFRSMSVSPGSGYYWPGPGFTPQNGKCYRTVTRWLGIYNGTAYDTLGVVSSTWCPTDRTFDVGGSWDSGLDAVPPLPPVAIVNT